MNLLEQIKREEKAFVRKYKRRPQYLIIDPFEASELNNLSEDTDEMDMIYKYKEKIIAIVYDPNFQGFVLK